MTDTPPGSASHDRSIADSGPSGSSGAGSDGSTGWAPLDKSLLWRESGEYNALFATQPVDAAHPDQGVKPNWREGAVALNWTAGLLSLTFVVLVVWERSSSGHRVAFHVAETLALGPALMLTIWVGQKYASARTAFYNRVRWIKAHEVEDALRTLQGNLSLEKLFVLNRKQLDEYHVLSVRQAAIAFRNATIATTIAFTVLIAGAVLSLRQGLEPSQRYVAAGLSGLGATLTTFVSRNFFRSWRETREQLREYYAEPARTSKLLGLERLAVERSETGPMIPVQLRQEIVTKLLDEFVADAKARREALHGGRPRGSSNNKANAETGSPNSQSEKPHAES
jgi:hypothetical protein